MWGSLFVGESFDTPFDMTGMDLDVAEICIQLSQHPMLKSQGQSIMGPPTTNPNPATPSEGSGPLTPTEPPKDLPDTQEKEKERIQTLAQQLTGNGQTYHRIHCKCIRKWALNEILLTGAIGSKSIISKIINDIKRPKWRIWHCQ